MSIDLDLDLTSEQIEHKPRVLVISSANMDLMMRVSGIPQPGQTITEEEYRYVPGGKGANSAIAFSRLGGDCIFCTRLGDDPNGHKLADFYRSEKLDTRFIKFDRNYQTGLAVVMVEDNGQNRIVAYPGANNAISISDLEEAFLSMPDAVYLQNEIPVEIVIEATRFAKKHDIPVFVDAGPAYENFPLDKLENVEIFSPNETETFTYTGIETTNAQQCMKACLKLQDLVKAKYYVLKLGSRGLFLYDGTFFNIIAAYDIDAVDTTAAGDAFTAALTLEYLRSHDIKRACNYANLVGALTVSKPGASTSIPRQSDVVRFINHNKIDFDL